LSGAQQPGSSEDEAAIRNVIVMTEGFNNHDGKAAARMYTMDARFVSVRSDVLTGQAEIERGLSATFSTRAKNAAQQTMDVKAGCCTCECNK
jgi:uncharacterized protein (TIGR02246 family)